MEKSFIELKELIEDNSDFVDIGKGASEEEVLAAESFLGVTFPKSLRSYLKEWGNLSIGPFEFYGTTGTTDFSSSAVPNGVWFTSSERNLVKLPNNLFVLYNNEGDEYHCVDVETEEIKIWDTSEAEIIGVKASNLFEYIIEESEDYI